MEITIFYFKVCTLKFQKAIDEHRQTLPEQPRDFIDVYLKRMMEEEKKGTAEQNGFLGEFFMAVIL